MSPGRRARSRWIDPTTAAIALYEDRRVSESEAVLRDAIERLPPAGEYAAAAFSLLGAIHRNRREFEPARRYARIAYGLAADEHDQSSMDSYTLELHQLAMKAKDYADAERWADLGRRGPVAAGDEDQVLWNLSLGEARAGAMDEDGTRAACGAAERHLRALREAPAGSSSPVVLARFLTRAGSLRRVIGESAAAIELLEDALTIARVHLAGTRELGAILFRAADVYWGQDDNDRALPRAREAVSLIRATDATDARGVLALLAELETVDGEIPAAKLLMDAIDEHPLPLDLDPEPRVAELMRRAEVQHQLGNDVLADELIGQALPLIRASGEERSMPYAVALFARTTVLDALGDPDRAREQYALALSHAEWLPPFHRQSLLTGWGAFLRREGDAEGARAAFEQALARDPDNEPGRLRIESHLAFFDIESGNYAAAARQLTGILERERSLRSPDDFELAISHLNVATALMLAGDFDPALTHLRAHDSIAWGWLRRAFAAGSASERIIYASKLRGALDLLLTRIAIPRPGSPLVSDELKAFAYEAVLRRKNLVGAWTALDRRAARSQQDPGRPNALEQLAEVNDEISRLSLDREAIDDESRSAVLAALVDRRRRIEASASHASPLTAEFSLGWRDVVDSVPANTVLIEIVLCWMEGVQTDEAAFYVAFVLSADASRPIDLVLLGLTRELDATIGAYRAAIAGGPSPLADGRDEQTLAGDLACRLRVCLDTVGRDADRIVIAPDGAYNQVPFEALPLGREGTKLIEAATVSYVTSGRDLVRWRRDDEPSTAPPVVFADPDFGPLADDCDSVPLAFYPLPEARAEGDWIARRLHVPLQADDDASEAVLRAVHGPALVHLATHGFFVPEAPWSHTRAREIDPEADLLCAGLALAGANRWLAGRPALQDGHDGLLTAADISTLDLQGTRLAVLSACDTGLGVYRAGEGVFGLRRSFELAGARAVVMSLWRVPSEPTRSLMCDFYRELLRGVATAQALHTAKLRLRSRFPETLFWGAFVCSGDVETSVL